MKRVLNGFGAVLTFTAASVSAPLIAFALSPAAGLASPGDIGISISESDTNPDDQRSDPWMGERTLFLWTSPLIQTAQGSEFSLIGNLQVVDLIPRPGVVNLGTPTSPTLLYGECKYYAVVAELRVLDSTGLGGTLCFTGSTVTGRNCSLLCGSGEHWQSHLHNGFASDGSVLCGGADYHPDCDFVVSTSDQSWSRIKAAYR